LLKVSPVPSRQITRVLPALGEPEDLTAGITVGRAVPCALD
jgi:hypothetical protein